MLVLSETPHTYMAGGYQKNYVSAVALENVLSDI
jgi:hypothetical protein